MEGTRYTTRIRRWLVGSTLLVLLLAACGVDSVEPAESVEATTEAASDRSPGEGTRMDEPAPTVSIETEDRDMRGEPPALEPAGGVTPVELAPVEVSAALSDRVALAMADLAQRLGVDAQAIVVTAAESVIWPNAGLGCPNPDMEYRDVPVDGIYIELSHGGAVYAYHGGGTRDPFLCEQDKGTSPIEPGTGTVRSSDLNEAGGGNEDL